MATNECTFSLPTPKPTLDRSWKKKQRERKREREREREKEREREREDNDDVAKLPGMFLARRAREGGNPSCWAPCNPSNLVAMPRASPPPPARRIQILPSRNAKCPAEHSRLLAL